MSGDYVPIAEVELGDAEVEAAVEALRSGFLVEGEWTEQFESEFASLVGADHAVAVSSGTAALHVAYLAALPENSEVLVPAMSHISTASMVEFADCRPVFCDVDPRTFTIDVEDAEERVTTDTVAVAPVHLFGNVCDIPGVNRLADDHDLTIIWDAAQAHGSTYDGQDVGSFADAVCYSFYPTKNMTTMEGGMITTNDADLAERYRRLKSHWQTEKYLHPDIGLNYRLTNPASAIGIQQLKKLEGFVETRRRNAAILNQGLESLEAITTPRVPDGVGHSYHQYSILLDLDQLGCTRDEFAETAEDEGVGTAVHYPRPIHRQPTFVNRYETSSLPISERICDRILSIPVHHHVDREDAEHIVTGLTRTVEHHGS